MCRGTDRRGARTGGASQSRNEIVFLFEVDKPCLITTGSLRTSGATYDERGRCGGARNGISLSSSSCGRSWATRLPGCAPADRVAYPRDTRAALRFGLWWIIPSQSSSFPTRLDVLERISAFGPTVPSPTATWCSSRARSERSGLGAAVEQGILVYIHKKRELDDVAQRFPAEH